jgi:hypothetical protein
MICRMYSTWYPLSSAASAVVSHSSTMLRFYTIAAAPAYEKEMRPKTGMYFAGYGVIFTGRSDDKRSTLTSATMLTEPRVAERIVCCRQASGSRVVVNGVKGEHLGCPVYPQPGLKLDVAPQGGRPRIIPNPDLKVRQMTIRVIALCSRTRRSVPHRH